MRVVVAVAVAALLAVGCSGGDGKPAAAGDFADATCVDLAPWASAIQGAFNDLRNIGALDVNDRAELATVIPKLRTSLGTAEKATADLAKGIKDRPAPRVSSGDAVKNVLVDGLTAVREFLSKTVANLNDFDPNTATPEQAAQLKTDLANVEADALERAAPLSVLQTNADLLKAFEGSQACKDASSSLVSNSS